MALSMKLRRVWSVSPSCSCFNMLRIMCCRYISWHIHEILQYKIQGSDSIVHMLCIALQDCIDFYHTNDIQQYCYLVDRLWPHPLKVGWRGLIYVHSGAVLKRLPLSQMTIGLHSSYFPEILLRVSGLTITPMFSVQSLPVWKTVCTFIEQGYTP